MHSFSYLLAVVLLCFSCTQTGTQTATPKPKPLTAAELQKLRWIEGSWRGSGDQQEAFFERYRFENETTLAVDSLKDDKVTETTLFVLQDGEFGGGSEGSRWVATSLEENSITFEPVANARNSFTWQRETKDSWKAVLKWPATKDKPARERIYQMERWPRQ
jgi:hypothetical protein